ncbi:MAG: 4-hydroxybenzoate octaprenyltransferase [Gemmataceae bacterium]|jgi:4-hydroxybenzoate polyprenyltransferase|nr:MAG: 4-hydroxybenzoate octaprenyltransferase [Gemmataceae bacterium]
MGQWIRRLLELIRFSHTVFALPFALTAAVLAWTEEPFRLLDLAGILWCMVSARSAAMAFNRIVDRHYDAANPRTAQRHLPTGQLSLRTVVLFCLLCCLAFVAGTLLFLWREPPNPWPLYLSGPVLVWILGYSYAKRFTSLAHFWLGSALMLAPLASWIALRGLTDLQAPLLLGAAVAFWVAGFDILYACQDAEFDRRTGLRSVPARLGVAAALRVAALCHWIMLVLLALLPLAAPPLGTIYYLGLLLVGALLAYEHYLVRPNDLSRVQQAFFQVNGVISIGIFLLVLVQVLFAERPS